MMVGRGRSRTGDARHWVNFYVIVGSSAGALTGLQFVVITLVAQAQAASSMREIRAFGTPTVVHFCAALLISAIMAVPWDALWQAGLCLGGLGIAGVVYALMVIRHARKQTGYDADIGDWCWFVLVPIVAYGALAAEGFLLYRNIQLCLFLIATNTLVFLFLGIRNAWDTVTYVAITRAQARNDHTE